ncbi:hypothetical protein PUV54_14235 [Hyphococcus flavus]|uniref:Uncharacterized protein n=1 Tax=Hyphococcus flavus TaxID=1866326 RepID=A0AAE9ZIR6_9PROT|nr:hypothetical protein [Hyphococcus flavus]WDI31110.1 hypothetical protein PUV54_14235 [Hyphococcus flavus]
MKPIRIATTVFAASLAAISAANAEIDAGAIFKLSAANVDAGASAQYNGDGVVDGVDFNDITWSGGHGGGTVSIVLEPGYTPDLDIWFRVSKAGGRTGGDDLLIYNNGDGSDFLEINCTNARVTSYGASSRKGGKVTLRCGRLNVRK